MIKLELKLDDVNRIISILSQGQYAQVADLIDNIRFQAIPQAQQAQESEIAEQIAEQAISPK